VRRLWPARREAHRDENTDFDEALIQVFARFGEIVISRLNQAPDKNLLAFLDMVGVSPLPMQAAEAPLTFCLAAGADRSFVPAGTQVAGPPPAGEKKPILFETNHDLFVSSAQLDSLFTRDGMRDIYADFSSVLSDPLPNAAAMPQDFAAPPAKLIPHVFYLNLPLKPKWPSPDRLRVHFDLVGPGASVDARDLQWEIFVIDDSPKASGTSPAIVKLPVPKAVTLTPSSDGTGNLMRSGDIVFENLPAISPTAVNGIGGYWLGCRLMTAITGSIEPVEGSVRSNQLPTVTAASLQEVAGKNLPLETAFLNGQKLDLSKDFLPFGERPKPGDAFYLGHAAAFSDPDARLILHIELTKASAAGTPPPAPEMRRQFSWEFWDGFQWIELINRHLRVLSLSDINPAGSVMPEFVDGTEQFTKSGEVSFTFPRPPAELNLNGQKSFWLRARIVSGDDARSSSQPPSIAPPSIHSIRLDYEVTKNFPIHSVVTFNDFHYARVTGQNEFKPFLRVSEEEGRPAFYFGFDSGTATTKNLPPTNPPFPRLPVSLYVESANTSLQEESDSPGGAGPSAQWEYWNGRVWKNFPVPDQTRCLQRSGMLHILGPEDFTPRQEFGRQRFWLRMRQNPAAPGLKIRGIRGNTIMATQGVTVLNEILGSSDAKPGQKFVTSQANVLLGQKLEVRELTWPPLRERRIILAEEGKDAIQSAPEPGGKRVHFWVTWHEVTAFHGSGPRDRHYVIDHSSGEVFFGDGVCGMIPPVLSGNIRMTRYRSGGGVRGNCPAQSVKQLVSAVPSIQKVINWQAAAGGADVETNSELIDRGPRGIRHGGRAVTQEDYEDLALLASRELARAKCVPLYDLRSDPDAKQKLPGVVSLILAPIGPTATPQPSAALLDRALRYLDRWRSPNVDLILVGPEYVRVSVNADVVVDESGLAGDVELKIRRALDNYLHPTTGGAEGVGWEFGRLPQRFDLYSLIQRISGVSHVRDLRLLTVADRPGAERSNRFLVCCGPHTLSIALEERYADQTA
jgi:hypothetical protein